MDIEILKGRLAFLSEAEGLKDVLRSAHTSSGRTESTAEHSWRLCLMAMVFEEQLAGLDKLKMLKLCVIHDLGEAINGDIPAVSKQAYPNKSQQERNDLLLLTQALDETLKAEILALWEDYEYAQSPEARAVKALDKLETILQHNQGKNPPDFDYAFNLGYGKKYTDATPLFEALRNLLDEGTRKNICMNITIRCEQPDDIDAIARVTEAAFANAAHSSHTEHFIVNALRRANRLPVSLVAVEHGVIIGHLAISPVTITPGTTDWYGLGPVSISPDRQQQGIGSALMNAALARLRHLGAAGCVVLGEPAYYGRFGFLAQAGLRLPGVPPEYFQALALAGEIPEGDVQYHEAFEATR
jgi:putative hydrolase of HD superfamily